MIFVFRFVSNQISHYVLKRKSLRFENQEITIYLIIFCNKWFGACMIVFSDSSKINGAPSNILVPLAIFRAYKDSYSLRTMTILDDDVVRMCHVPQCFDWM